MEGDRVEDARENVEDVLQPVPENRKSAEGAVDFEGGRENSEFGFVVWGKLGED